MELKNQWGMMESSQTSLFVDQEIIKIWEKIDDLDFLKFLDKLKALPDRERELVMGYYEGKNNSRK